LPIGGYPTEKLTKKVPPINQAVLSRMSPLLLELWREQRPNGHEQTMLDFKARGVAAQKVPLFAEDREGN
jgi:hypothetical protein